MLSRTFSNLENFAHRRQQLQKQITNEAALILRSGKEGYISRFRAQSSFVYLTGFEEADSWMVLRFGQEPSYSLFVLPKNPEIERWDGKRFGPEAAQSEFKADKAYSNEELLTELPRLLNGVEDIYYDLGQDEESDRLLLEARTRAKSLQRRSGRALASIKDPNELLAPLRVVKDRQELEFMGESGLISSQAHMEVMKATAPGVNERALMGVFLNSIYEQGAWGEGYASIVATGTNATVLHYRDNRAVLSKEDFLLIDAGAEKNFYTADITRTYPVSGSFSPEQRDFYQAVLDVQKKLIEQVKPDFSLPELHDLSCRWLCEKMKDLKLLQGSLDELMEKKKYLNYYPHGVGHYLGMDVHDLGLSQRDGKPNPFVPGMVITVEPGLYVPKNDESAPEAFRGFGVRIEDDVAISQKGPQLLSSQAPKEVHELEALVGSLKK